MSEDVMNDVMRSLGRIEQKIDGHAEWMRAHVEDDRKMAADISSLQQLHARQKGFITAMSSAGAFLGAIVGAAAEYFGHGHR